jgi:hypothetical protein
MADLTSHQRKPNEQKKETKQTAHDSHKPFQRRTQWMARRLLRQQRLGGRLAPHVEWLAEELGYHAKPQEPNQPVNQQPYKSGHRAR